MPKLPPSSPSFSSKKGSRPRKSSAAKSNSAAKQKPSVKPKSAAPKAKSKTSQSKTSQPKTSKSNVRKPKPISKTSPKSQVKKRPLKQGSGSSAQKKQHQRSKRQDNGGFSKRRLAKYALIAGIWMTFLGVLFVFWFAYDLPAIEKLALKPRQPHITILSSNQERIATVGSYYDKPVDTKQLPDHVIKPFLATEDRRFFDHFGIDVFGLLRAAYRNFRAGHVVQGGSTITQQLAKNFLLTEGLYTYQDRSLRRKIQEVLLSIWLEVKLTKHDILTIYLNRVYFGSGAFGLGAAAQHYFNKKPTSLTTYEAARLAGLLKAPTKYSPFANREASDKRTKIVMLALLDAGFIDQNIFDGYENDNLKLRASHISNTFGRYFVDWVVESVPELTRVADEDLIITTTLDSTLQTHAEILATQTMSSIDPSLNVNQVALVAMTPEGAVKAMVGGKHYAHSQFNRVTQAYRQTGSVFKLFVYLAALENGFLPERKIQDGQLSIGGWSPKNYGWTSRGAISFQDAFAYSVNTVSVRLAKFAGVSRVQNCAYRLGLSLPQPQDLTMALGSGEASLLEMAGAFAHVANHGLPVQPYGITNVKTRSGQVLYDRAQNKASSGRQALILPDHLLVMKKNLAAVMNYGTGRKVSLKGYPCYGKSGTSQDYKDAWFIGFTDKLVTGVWMGNDDNIAMNKVTGAKLPGKLWQSFMSTAIKSQ